MGKAEAIIQLIHEENQNSYEKTFDSNPYDLVVYLIFPIQTVLGANTKAGDI